MDYIFKFGNTPQLSQLELDSIYHGGNPLDVADKLGGTVKIAEKIGPISEISSYLISLNLPKIDFGISGAPELSKKVKRDLEEVGIKARFVLPKPGDQELSSVVVAKQKLIELVVDGDSFGRTIWVQDFESWNSRDYGRPKVDPHAGMLPPKLARMMVNIALSSSFDHQSSILDPFCGVGTVLAEGLMVGKKVIGSDVSEAQVENSKANLAWLKNEFSSFNFQFSIFQSDARNLSKKLTEKVDAIVTEPDLGRTNPKYIDPKLGDLYIACLEDWRHVLQSGGKVVMILPTISQDKQLYLVKKVLDKAILMGYSEFHKPIEYFRPQAVVKRNIIFLTYGTH